MSDGPGVRRPIIRRVLGWAVLVAVAVCAIAAGLATKVVLWPHVDRPVRADAVVVLSGDHGERLARAKVLLQAGVAPTLVMAGAPDSSQAALLCRGGQVFEVVCLRPQPDNTRTEARATAALASSRHWRTLLVVTSIPHVSRSRLLFSRCFSGTLDMVGAKPPYRGLQAIAAEVHEVLGMVYARVWARSC